MEDLEPAVEDSLSGLKEAEAVDHDLFVCLWEMRAMVSLD